MLILEYLDEFYGVLAVLEERKQEGRVLNTLKMFRNWQIGPLKSIWALLQF